MSDLMRLPRNDEGIETALGLLKQRLGDRFVTGRRSANSMVTR